VDVARQQLVNNVFCATHAGAIERTRKHAQNRTHRNLDAMTTPILMPKPWCYKHITNLLPVGQVPHLSLRERNPWSGISRRLKPGTPVLTNISSNVIDWLTALQSMDCGLIQDCTHCTKNNIQ
jgi:hypothetical protein